MDEARGKLLEELGRIEQREKDELFELLDLQRFGRDQNGIVDAVASIRELISSINFMHENSSLSSSRALEEFHNMRERDRRISDILMRICSHFAHELNTNDSSFDMMIELLAYKFPPVDELSPTAPKFVKPKKGDVWCVGTGDTLRRLEVMSVGDLGAHCRTWGTTALPDFIPFPCFYNARLILSERRVKH